MSGPAGYTLAEAAQELARRDCEGFGHDVTETSVGTMAGGTHPVRLDCDRRCGHQGWLLVANGPEPEPRAYAPEERWPLEEAALHLLRQECHRLGHDLELTYPGREPGNRGEFGRAVHYPDPSGVRCRRACGHPGWRAVPVMCASHPDLLDASRGA